MTTTLQFIIYGGIGFMLLCLFGLLIEINRLRAKIRRTQEDAAFYRKWLLRAVFNGREDLFV